MDKGKIYRILIGNGLKRESFESIDEKGIIYAYENGVHYKLEGFKKTIIKKDEENSQNEIENTDEEILEKIKKIKKPRGWHFKDEFIDSEGNVYNKGILKKIAKKDN